MNNGEDTMKGVGRWATVAAMVMAAFAGGAFMQWLCLGDSVAHAAGANQAAAREMRAQEHRARGCPGQGACAAGSDR